MRRDPLERFVDLLVRYGALAVLLFSFLENAGLPIPAFPVLVAAGALAQSGGVSVGPTILGAVAGALVADLAWYGLGRWRGRRLLSSLCRVTLNPDACVERAEHGFHDRPRLTILLAKFLPGVNTLVPPLAGSLPVPLSGFLVLDLCGSVLWAAAGIGLGWLFGAELAEHARALQGALGWLLLGGVAAYLLWRAGYRHYLVRRYSVPRLEPEELFGKIAAGEDPLVLDLRSDLSFEESGKMVAGAVRARPARFHRVAHALSPGRELVFYCT